MLKQPPYYYVHSGTILKETPWGYKHLCIMLYVSACYSLFIVEFSVPVISQQALVAEFPSLGNSTYVWNTVIAVESIARVTSVIGGMMVDYYGRYYLVLASFLSSIIFSVLGSYTYTDSVTTNMVLYILFRGLVVLSGVHCGMYGPIWAIECLGVQYRAMVFFSCQVLCALCYMAATGFEWSLEAKTVGGDWRAFQRYVHLPMLPFVAFGLLVFSESPMWLLAKRFPRTRVWDTFLYFSGQRIGDKKQLPLDRIRFKHIDDVDPYTLRHPGRLCTCRPSRTGYDRTEDLGIQRETAPRYMYSGTLCPQEILPTFAHGWRKPDGCLKGQGSTCDGALANTETTPRPRWYAPIPAEVSHQESSGDATTFNTRENIREEHSDTGHSEKEYSETERPEKMHPETEHPETEHSEREHSEREGSEKEDSEREGSERERSEKEDSEREGSERERSGKEDSEKEDSERERIQRRQDGGVPEINFTMSVGASGYSSSQTNDVGLPGTMQRCCVEGRFVGPTAEEARVYTDSVVIPVYTAQDHVGGPASGSNLDHDWPSYARESGSPRLGGAAGRGLGGEELEGQGGGGGGQGGGGQGGGGQGGREQGEGDHEPIGHRGEREGEHEGNHWSDYKSVLATGSLQESCSLQQLSRLGTGQCCGSLQEMYVRRGNSSLQSGSLQEESVPPRGRTLNQSGLQRGPLDESTGESWASPEAGEAGETAAPMHDNFEVSETRTVVTTKRFTVEGYPITRVALITGAPDECNGNTAESRSHSPRDLRSRSPQDLGSRSPRDVSPRSPRDVSPRSPRDVSPRSPRAVFSNGDVFVRLGPNGWAREEGLAAGRAVVAPAELGPEFGSEQGPELGPVYQLTNGRRYKPPRGGREETGVHSEGGGFEPRQWHVGARSWEMSGSPSDSPVGVLLREPDMRSVAEIRSVAEMRNAEIRSGDIRSAEVRVLETRAREARPTRRAVGPVYLADGHSAFCMPWLVLVRKPYAPVMATLCAVWFLTAWSYWGLVTYCNLFFLELGVNVNLVTMLNYAVQLPLHVVAFHLMRVTWGGRRSALKVLSVFGALVCAALAFTVGLGMKTVWVLSALAIVTMAIGTALWGPLISYSSERFPTELRGTAIGVFSAFTGLSTLATSYVGSVSFNSRSIWLLPLFWGVARCGVYLAVQQLDFDIRENELSDERSHCYF